ncbi:MAG: NAD-dependent epimerase/dehydratase family protein [Micromonosporaceae bacterium]
MRLLVFGGSVFLSRTVAELAVRQGHDVTCVNRGVSGTVPEGVRHVVGDRDADDGLAGVKGEQFDAVVDIARRPSQVRRAVRDLSADVGHWTFVSTANVYADTATPGQHADTAPLLQAASPDADETQRELYGPLKVACEDVVRAELADRALIVRAGLIGGPHDTSDRFSYWPLRLARGGEVVAPGGPENLIQVIDVRDLAGWFVRAAEQGVVGTYDGIGDTMTFGKFLERVAVGVGAAPPPLTWMDQEFLLAHNVETYMGERSLPLWVPLPEYAGWQTRDGSPARAAGLRCRDIADSARETLAWARQARRAFPGKAGLTEAEEAELLAAWHCR